MLEVDHSRAHRNIERGVPEDRLAGARQEGSGGAARRAARRGGRWPRRCGRYERTAERETYRIGHYERKLTTTSGKVTIRMSKPEGMRFTTAITERYRRRETNVEEAMIETCLAGVSTRCIEDVSEIL